MLEKKLHNKLIKHIQKNKLFNQDDHVVVAFSGGHDSLTLLKWLTDQQLPQALQPKVSVLYVNHQLRADAEIEEQFVQKVFAQTPGLQHTKMVRLAWSKQPTSGIEEQARDRRYAALIDFADEIGANKIVTAHHQTDQAETILYKLIRGGHINQLKGMQDTVKLTDKIALVRPFLGLPKASLDKLLSQPLTEWIEDISNVDNHFARNRLRNQVIPELTTINQQAQKHLVQMSEQLAGMTYLLQPELNKQLLALQAGTFDWQMPDVAIKYILQEWLNAQGVFQVKMQQLDQVIQLMRNQSVAQGEVALEAGYRLVRNGHSLRLVQIGQKS